VGHVHQQRSDGSLRGVLLNDPILVDGLHWGDEVAGFGAAHIYEAAPLN